MGLDRYLGMGIMTKHSPLPWRFEPWAIVSGDMTIADVCSPVTGHDGAELDRANAAFIVMAVNNHAAFVRVLEEIANCSSIPIALAKEALARLKEPV